jgi:hypothetical protein
MFILYRLRRSEKFQREILKNQLSPIQYLVIEILATAFTVYVMSIILHSDISYSYVTYSMIKLAISFPSYPGLYRYLKGRTCFVA